MKSVIHWPGDENRAVTTTVELLLKGGKTVVSPTNVGYILITIDFPGLERKFDLKERPKTKPGVVLCSSIEQLVELAEVTPEILKLYQNCFEANILLGCILPWKESGRKYIPNDGSSDLVMDNRGTSCFVVKFGIPSEQIAKELWEKHRKLVFASSANPSGKGNRGRLQGVGDRIIAGADLLIEADDFVKAQQPAADESSRYEQGPMVSFVNDNGKIEGHPVVIRRGLAVEQVMLQLSRIFDSFDYRQWSYH